MSLFANWYCLSLVFANQHSGYDAVIQAPTSATVARYSSTILGRFGDALPSAHWQAQVTSIWQPTTPMTLGTCSPLKRRQHTTHSRIPCHLQWSTPMKKPEIWEKKGITVPQIWVASQLLKPLCVVCKQFYLLYCVLSVTLLALQVVKQKRLFVSSSMIVFHYG